MRHPGRDQEHITRPKARGFTFHEEIYLTFYDIRYLFVGVRMKGIRLRLWAIRKIGHNDHQVIGVA